MPSNFADLRLAEGIVLIPHPLAKKRVPNFTVENVKVPRRVYGGGKCACRPPSPGSARNRASQRVALMLNGRESGSKQVEVPAGGRASVEFLTLDAPFGMNRGEIRVDPARTNFRPTTACNFSIERADPRHILFVHEERNQKTAGCSITRPRSRMPPRRPLSARTGGGGAGGQRLAGSKYAIRGAVGRRLAACPVRERAAEICAQRRRPCWSRWDGHVGDAQQRAGVRRSDLRTPTTPPAKGERFQTAAYVDPAHPAVGGAHQWDT